MATAAAIGVGTSFLTSLAKTATDLVTEELTLLWGLEDDVQSLAYTFSMIGDFLEDAEKKQLEDCAVEVWLRQLKGVAYDAEDVLDEFATEAALRRRGRVSTYTCSSPLACVRPVSFRHDLAHRVVGIRQRLKQITEDQRNLRLESSGGATTQSDAIWKDRETTSLLDEEPIGRDDKKKEIIDILLSSSGGPAPSPNSGAGGVSLISIVDMGGIGKTTIAKAVFNDPKVEEHFPVIRKWLFVGRTFDARALMEKITGSPPLGQDKKPIPNPTLEDFQKALIEKLKDGRFLIVLDDVWSEKQEEWEQLWKPLSHEGNQGKVLVTTRTKTISRLVKDVSTKPIQLGRLSDGDCQKIFERHAFGCTNNDDQSNLLKQIGGRIVKKLEGVPLAAKALGGFLYNAPEETWRRIESQSEKWSLIKNGNYDILPILRVSYQHLATPLKQCFAFCSMFPKGYEFEETKLVNIWIASGLIQPQRNVLMEDIGRLYFDELASRSFFQYINGVYKMHDLMHDLAQSISKDECLTADKTSFNVDWGNVRHLSYFGNASDLEGLRKIRTLLCRDWENSTINAEFFNQIACIRVLDLRGTSITELPKCIGALKHLRYLDVRNHWLEKLPESLCDLHNLQTLKARYCCELPKGMNRLINLRHLEADPQHVSKITEIWRLTSLQELNAFSVNKTNGNKIQELDRMAHLRQLSLRSLENVESIDEVGQVNMKDKLYLDELELVWSQESTDQREELVEGVLEGLQPRQGLKSLRIENYRGSRQPSWIQSQILFCIVSIHLCNCSKWKTLPNLGQFRSLHKLVIRECPVLTELPDLPSTLLKLEIRDCPVLTELPDLPSTLLRLTMVRVGLHKLPEFWDRDLLQPAQKSIDLSLQLLRISNCNNLTTLSPLSKHRLKHLQKIDIHHCKELVSFFEGEIKGTLLQLEIRDCPVLIELPDLPSTLLELEMYGVGLHKLPEFRDRDLLQPAQKSIDLSLQLLRISICDNLTTLSPLSQHRLKHLQEIDISHCEELVSFFEGEMYDDLVSLATLSINGCSKLSLEEGLFATLTSLSSLDIMGHKESVPLPPSLESLETDNLSLIASRLLSNHPVSLKELTIRSCGELTSFTKEEDEAWGRNLASLRRLTFNDCQNLRSLPKKLRSLSSLVVLCIFDCPQVVRLPEEGLPISLRDLYISGCPQLRKSCKGWRAPDRHKIAHIPRADIY